MNACCITRSLIACLAIALLAPFATGQVVYQDGDFATWTSTHRGTTGTDAQMVVLPTGGNPDAHLEATTVSGGASWLFMWSDALVWDPATDGALGSVELQLDFRSISCWGQGQRVHPLLVQGGRFYVNDGDTTGTAGCTWSTLAFAPLGECEFRWVTDQETSQPANPAGSGPPNFGPSGEPLSLGFAVTNTNSGTYTQLYDNFQMTLTGAAPYVSCMGTSYCSPAVPNSTGVPGTIHASGSVVIAVNDLVLEAADLPPGQFGYFLTGMTQGSATPPMSQGVICLSATIGRFNQPAQVGQGPVFDLQVDLTAIPVSPTQAVQSGETWHFQCWYRDIGNTSNFTDAVSVTFF